MGMLIELIAASTVRARSDPVGYIPHVPKKSLLASPLSLSHHLLVHSSANIGVPSDFIDHMCSFAILTAYPSADVRVDSRNFSSTVDLVMDFVPATSPRITGPRELLL